MRLHIYIVLLIISFFTGMSSSFATARQKHDKFIIILDGSAKMNTTWRDDLNKYDAASLLISRLMDSMHTANEDVQFCLRLYGHLYPATMRSCKDSRLEVYFSKDNRSQTRMRLGSMQPQGSASLGYALQQSANYDIDDWFDNYNIILITSGARYCDSNVCASAGALLNKISLAGVIISLSLNFYLIPMQEALGAAITSCITQTVLAICYIVFCSKEAQLPKNTKWISAHIAFVILLAAVAYVVKSTGLHWFAQVAITGVAGIIGMVAFRFVSVKSVQTLLQKK